MGVGFKKTKRIGTQNASEFAKSFTTLHWNMARSSPPTLTTYLQEQSNLRMSAHAASYELVG